VEGGEHAQLGREDRGDRGSRGDRGEELEGDVAAELLVAGEVDLRHTPRADDRPRSVAILQQNVGVRAVRSIHVITPSVTDSTGHPPFSRRSGLPPRDTPTYRRPTSMPTHH